MRGRIRTIKPEFFTDEKVWDLAVEYGAPIVLLFQALWCYADRDGRFEWRSRPIKAAALPYWDGNIDTLLAALDRAGLIRKYTVAGKDYGLVVNLHKHQAINAKEAKSLLPEPPVTAADASSEFIGIHRNSGGEGKGMGREWEGNGNGNGKDASRDAVHPSPAAPEVFDLPIDEPPKTQRDLPVPPVRLTGEASTPPVARESSPPPQVAPRVAQAQQSNSRELPAGWRPRNRQECVAAPIAQRAEWAMRELHWAAEYSPETWPEVLQVAAAFGAAYKLGPPRLGRLNSDRHGTQRIVSLLAQYTPAQLVAVCQALPREKFSLDRIGAGDRPRLGWLSDEVVRTAFGALPSERPISERVRRMTAHLEPMKETGS